MSAYHSDFWIAIAAATPVIALGYLVAIAVTLRVVVQLIRADAVATKEANARRRAGQPGPGSGVRASGWKRQASAILRAIAFAVLTAITLKGIDWSLEALDNALNSLANTRDVTNPHVAVGHTFAGLITLLGLTGLTAIGDVVFKTSTGHRLLRALRIENPQP